MRGRGTNDLRPKPPDGCDPGTNVHDRRHALLPREGHGGQRRHPRLPGVIVGEPDQVDGIGQRRDSGPLAYGIRVAGERDLGRGQSGPRHQARLPPRRSSVRSSSTNRSGGCPATGLPGSRQRGRCVAIGTPAETSGGRLAAGPRPLSSMSARSASSEGIGLRSGGRAHHGTPPAGRVAGFVSAPRASQRFRS